MKWNISPGACAAVFTKMDTDAATASSAHTGVSASVDEAATVFSDAKVNKVATALNGLYSRCLTRQMTNADKRITDATTSGRNVVTAFTNGQESRADSIPAESGKVDWHAQITDGKKVWPCRHWMSPPAELAHRRQCARRR